jgi:hypothetical protein
MGCSSLGIGEKYKILVEKAEGKRQNGRARRRWKNNINVGNKLLGCGLNSAGLV